MKCDYKNGNTVVLNIDSIFPNNTIYGTYFEDEDGNVEVYVPENDYHTGFYVKFPKEQVLYKILV